LKIGTSEYIQDIAPTLAHCYIKDLDFEQGADARNAYYERFKTLDERYRLSRMRLGGRLHDSYVLSREKTDDRYVLWLNDVATLDFAGALRDKKGLQINDEMEFPLGIVARDVKRLSLCAVNERSGRIMPCCHAKLWQYLYEEIISWDESGVEIAFVLVSDQIRVSGRSRRQFRNAHALMLIACGHLGIDDEMQDEAWHKYFGRDFDDYYSFFKRKRDEGVFLSDYTECRKLIDEFEAIGGLNNHAL
jgi:hypothetical protein